MELRGKNLASVLPPSIHPLTGHYFWLKGCRPDEIEVALAPDWILEQMTVSIKERSQTCRSSGKTTLTARKIKSLPITTTSSSTEIKQALLLLEVIHPKFADDYNSWIRVGMALKSISPSLLSAWDTWSQLSPKYIKGECEYKWEHFSHIRSTIRTLYYFSKL